MLSLDGEIRLDGEEREGLENEGYEGTLKLEGDMLLNDDKILELGMDGYEA
jgi:hypothetical protein